MDMYLDNENTGTSANESTGITISRDSGDPRPKKPLTNGSISVNWSKVYVAPPTILSGENVITGDIADVPTKEEIRQEMDTSSTQLSAIKARTDNIQDGDTVATSTEVSNAGGGLSLIHI